MLSGCRCIQKTGGIFGGVSVCHAEKNFPDSPNQTTTMAKTLFTSETTSSLISTFLNPHEFTWIPGVTPLASPAAIITAWIIYGTTILSLRIYMDTRPAYKLVFVTLIHNLILTFWSLIMFLYATYDFYQLYITFGFTSTFCYTSLEGIKGRLFYVTYWYYLSKFYELLDTAILVLKKVCALVRHHFKW